MFALSCIFDRSAAMTNSVGADRLAETVWPTSTLRAITTPSIGDRITVFARLTSAVSTAARACWIFASPPMTCEAADRLAVCADSRSTFGQQLLRGQLAGARQRHLRRGGRDAQALRIGLRARRAPRACSSALAYSDWSRVARISPFRTSWLKSARSDSTVPETWLPTWTVVTAWSVAVAEIAE